MCRTGHDKDSDPFFTINTPTDLVKVVAPLGIKTINGLAMVPFPAVLPLMGAGVAGLAVSGWRGRFTGKIHGAMTTEN